MLVTVVRRMSAQVAQYSSPRFSIFRFSTLSASTPSAIAGFSPGAASSVLAYTRMPSALPRSSAARQCSSRSSPPGFSAQGCEPFTFGAHSRVLCPVSDFCSSSNGMASTTTPSSCRTPPRLQVRLCRTTPRFSNALPRESSRRTPFGRVLRTDAWPRGRMSRTSLHSAATSGSFSCSALTMSCRSSGVLRVSIFSRSHLATRPRGRSAICSYLRWGQKSPANRACLNSTGLLGRPDVRGVGAFGALADVVLHLVILLQRLEAAALNGGEVNEKVFAAIVRRDEAETLGVVEPLDGTCTHVCFLDFKKKCLDLGPEPCRESRKRTT